YATDDGLDRIGTGTRTDLAQPDEADTQNEQGDPVTRAAIAPGLDLAAIQPGQEEQDEDGAEHRDDTEQLVRYHTQHRVERRVVPGRLDVHRRHQAIGLDEIVVLEEQSA